MYSHANLTSQAITPSIGAFNWIFDQFVRGQTPDPQWTVNVGGQAIPSGYCEVLEATYQQWAQFDSVVDGVYTGLNTTPQETWKYQSGSLPEQTFSRFGRVLIGAQYVNKIINMSSDSEEDGDEEGEGGGQG